MASASSSSEDRLYCERCSGVVAVQVEDGKATVRCASCGHTRELTEAKQQETWTVTGPDGTVRTFTSWEELAAAQRPSAVTAVAQASRPAPSPPPPAEDKKSSAAAMLAITPSPALVVASDDTDPNIGDLLARAREATKSKAPKEPLKTSASLFADAKGFAEAAAAPEPAPEPRADRFVEELSSRVLLPDHSDDEPEPLSLADAVVEKVVEERAKARIKDRDHDDDPKEESSHETVSLKDLVVVPAIALPAEGAPATVSDRPRVSKPPPVPAKSLAPKPSSDPAITAPPPPPAATKSLAPKPSSDPAITAPPPPRGTLKTLPPKPPEHGLSAPPPTITVEEPPASKGASTNDAPTTKERRAKDLDESPSSERNGSPKKKARKGEAGKGTKSRAPSSKPKLETENEGRMVASARAELAEEPKNRGWLAPTIAIVVVLLVGWRFLAPSAPAPTPSPPTNATTTPPTATATATATTPATTTTAATTAPVPTTTTSGAATPATATAVASAVATAIPGTAQNAPPPVRREGAPAPIASGGPAPDTALDGLSMSELLDRAAKARRSGDWVKAREFYDRVLKMSPGNVEANGGLGDVSRAQGDLAGARASYEAALAASPSYGPALLGLADTAWDTGDRSQAQRLYAQIVERQGDRAPERARQRSTAAAAPAPAPAPASAQAPAPTATSTE